MKLGEGFLSYYREVLLKSFTFSNWSFGGRQMHGFTCGFGDLLLVPKAEKMRRQKLKQTDDLGDTVNARYVGEDENAGEVALYTLIVARSPLRISLVKHGT
jgi:hypothetical protein